MICQAENKIKIQFKEMEEHSFTTDDYGWVLNKEKTINQNSNLEHFVLNGPSYENLLKLKKIKPKQFDCIVVDAPYNANNEKFIFKKQKVKKNDDFKHSKWLNFMKNRLIIAKDLLSDEGIIAVHVDNHELGHAILLLNEFFGPENMVDNLIWQKNAIKNNSKTTSTIHEYILIYAKNKKKIEELNTYFKTMKPGFIEVMNLCAAVQKQDTWSLSFKKEQLLKEVKTFYKKHPELKGITQYKQVDDRLVVYSKEDISKQGGDGYVYDVFHPITKRKVKKPSRGWKYPKEKLETFIQADLIDFGKDEKHVPRKKKFLHNHQFEPMKSVIINTEDGTKDLHKIVGPELKKEKYHHPKPVSLMKTIIGMVGREHVRVLDMFSESNAGTVFQAVCELEQKSATTYQLVTLLDDYEGQLQHQIIWARMHNVIEKTKTKRSIVWFDVVNEDEMTEETQLETFRTNYKMKLNYPILWKKDEIGEVLEQENENWVFVSTLDELEGYIHSVLPFQKSKKQTKFFYVCQSELEAEYAELLLDEQRTSIEKIWL